MRRFLFILLACCVSLTLKAQVVDNIMNAFTGHAASVRITQASSQLGQFASSIDIRGFTSYQDDRITPTQTGVQLFLIDGIPTIDQKQHNVTISGGSERVQSFTSIGYYQAGGEVASGIDGDKKCSFRQSVTTNIAKGANTSNAILWNSLIKKTADG